MKCDYCGTEIPAGTEFMSDGGYFCNSLHRNWWHEHNVAGNQSTIGNLSQTTKKQLLSGKQWGLIFTAIFAVIGGIVGAKVANGIFGSGSIDKQLMQIAIEINQTCPIMLDNDTRLDNTVAGPGKTFVYNYRLISWLAEEINIPELQNYIRPRVTKTAKTSPDMEFIRENGVTLVYRYSDKSGNFVFEIKVTPDDYR